MTEGRDALPPPSGDGPHATIVIRAWFDDPDVGAIVRDELVGRGYATEALVGEAGAVLVTVTAPAALRAEVEGLMWLRGGRPT